MVNQEFQALRSQIGVNLQERSSLINKMKDNLTKRNKGEDEYTFAYTRQDTVNISQCKDVEELCAIDGDMNPRGM